MANPQPYSSLARLILALRAEKIRFMIVGMSAAVIQGAPVVTFDTDIWLGLRRVPVLALKRIYRSKSVIRRPKDIAHMEVLKQLMACEKQLERKP